jgi:hypothetical protein
MDLVKTLKKALPRYIINQIESQFSTQEDPRLEDIIDYLKRTSWVNQQRESRGSQPATRGRFSDFGRRGRDSRGRARGGQASQATSVLLKTATRLRVRIVRATRTTAMGTAMTATLVTPTVVVLTVGDSGRGDYNRGVRTFDVPRDNSQRRVWTRDNRDGTRGGRGQVPPSSTTVQLASMQSTAEADTVDAKDKPPDVKELYFSTKVAPRISMVMPGRVAGLEWDITLDTAATSSFISSDLATRVGLQIDEVDVSAYGPDGTTLNVKGMATVPLSFGALHTSIRAVVADLAKSTVYLGDDFLLQARAVLDYDDKVVTLRVGKEKHAFHLGSNDISHVLGKPLSLSAMMASHGLKPDQAILCAVVLEKPDSNGVDVDSLPQVLRDLLHEFTDRFPDELPDGLPPDRGINHVIELEPGFKPKPGYLPSILPT